MQCSMEIDAACCVEPDKQPKQTKSRFKFEKMVKINKSQYIFRLKAYNKNEYQFATNLTTPPHFHRQKG